MDSMLRLALAATLLCVTPCLHAGFLTHSVGLTFEIANNEPVAVGDPPPPPFTTDFGVRTAGAGIEFPNAREWDVDIADTSVRFALGDTAVGSHWALIPVLFGFQGFHLRDADGTLPDIVGVSIGFDSHVGLDPSKISFDADNVLVDMTLFIPTGWVFGTSGDCANAPPGLCQEVPILIRIFQPEFVLNVQFAAVQAVPEPATALMVLSGLVVLAAGRRKRSRR